MRQVREVIWEREEERRQQLLGLEETKLRYLVGAVHAAAGNKKGARAAQKIRLTPKEAAVPSTEQVTRLFPVDDAAGGMFTPEQLAQARARTAERTGG